MTNKIIIEILGGCVAGVYTNDPKTEVLVIDHDSAIMGEADIAGLDQINLADFATYNGQMPRSWKL